MKKLLCILSIILIGCSQFQNKQQKAESLIKRYLDSVLNDPHSYEGVSFTKLDTAKDSYLSSPEWDKIETKKVKVESDLSVEEINEQYPALYNHVKELVKVNQLKKDSVYYNRQLDSLETDFKQKQVGWYIKHTYRAKNGFGALGLHTTTFTIDISLNKVLDATEEKN